MSTSLFPELSVVMAAFNEEPNLLLVTEEIFQYLKGAVLKYELIIVNDGSQDQTGAIAVALAQKYPWIRVVHFSKNRGIGAALKRGFYEARYDYITIMPSDGQIDPAVISKFLRAIPNADMVISTYDQRDDALHRLALSKILRLIIAIVVGTNIKHQGIYLFRRSLLNQVKLISNTFFMSLEFPIRVYRAGFKMDSVIISARARLSGQSKEMRLARMLKVLAEVVGMRLDDLFNGS